MAEVFPSINPTWPVAITPRWNTLVSEFDSGEEQRRQKLLYAVYDVNLTFPPLVDTDAQTVWEFYMARKGSVEAFYYYDPRPAMGMTVNHDGLYVDTGDGATQVYDLPGKSTGSVSIYVDSVLQTLTTDYVLLTGGGDGSADRVDFVSNVADGGIITCDFTGELRIRCRFAQDNLSFELFEVLLHTIGIKLRGLQAA